MPCMYGTSALAPDTFSATRSNGGRIAAVEFEILVRLDDDQIPRKLIGDPVAKTQSLGQVVRRPGAEQRRVQLLPVRGGGRRPLGPRQILGRAQGGIRRLEEHPQKARVGIGETAFGVRIRGRQDALRARLIGEIPLDEVIDGAHGGLARRGDRIA